MEIYQVLFLQSVESNSGLFQQSNLLKDIETWQGIRESWTNRLEKWERIRHWPRPELKSCQSPSGGDTAAATTECWTSWLEPYLSTEFQMLTYYRWLSLYTPEGSPLCQILCINDFILRVCRGPIWQVNPWLQADGLALRKPEKVSLAFSVFTTGQQRTNIHYRCMITNDP